MKVRLFFLILIFLACLMAAAGCSQANAGVVDDQLDVLEGISWKLVAYRKSKPHPGSRITAVFEDGMMYGSAGCNNYHTAYRLEGERIYVAGAGHTMMLCFPEAIMEDEDIFLDFLNNAYRFELEGERLYIYRDAREALTFERIE